jgi:hypothetical protein
MYYVQLHAVPADCQLKAGFVSCTAAAPTAAHLLPTQIAAPATSSIRAVESTDTKPALPSTTHGTYSRSLHRRPAPSGLGISRRISIGTAAS